MSSRTPILTFSLLLLGAVALACGDLGVPVSATARYRPECPHTWPDSLQFGEPGNPAQPALLSGPGPIKNVPEFHDCQRFVVGQGASMRYDSLFGIFATFRLTRLDTLLLAFQEQAQFTDPETRLTGLEGLPAAEIVAWNDYEPLEIRSGFNCLYLYLRAGPTGRPGWNARMVSYGPTEQDCSEPVDLNTIGGADLVVTEDRHARLPDMEDYPAVARWDWDDARRQHYIGIRCGPAWCSVSKPGLSASPTYAQQLPGQGSGLSDAQFRVHHAKGWYDEQHLALASASGVLEPSNIRGTLIPRPRLDTLDVMHFTGRWVPMAWVALDVPTGQANPYEDKFNLAATAPQAVGSQLNQVFLCTGTKSECTGVPADAAPCGDGAWWAAVESPGGARMYRCSHRRVMSTATIAPTVRWRWLTDDEGIWMRCPGGCCDLTEN